VVRGTTLGLLIVALAVPALAFPGAARGGDMRGPGIRSAARPPLQFAAAKGSPPAPGEAAFPAAPWLGLLDFYRNTVSAVDGDRCSMWPTCSRYSRQAIERHGVLLGMLLTADRLLHEADEIPHVPVVQIRGKPHSRDPLESNTYWW